MSSNNAQHEKDPARVAAGLKAAIHNPNVSEEAKDRAAQRLEEMDVPTADPQPTAVPPENKHVLAGYKATLHNENTSEEAKAHAREILSAAGYHEDDPDSDTHNTRVLAGYKAALSNPRISAAAKLHALEYLTLHDAI
ncbi:hypothetical protein BD779DRAFT_1668356 [Infundibulicybe gibba]|nr:hypothetical protein BD779DRAFT_1668356 [Infundibulicybe gibba]